ncbi:MAG: TetR/AcrR family transcriptional regulator [Burkholderiaceae bacterium]
MVAVPPRASPRKKMGRPPATDNPRRQIVRAAARLFAEKGYEASSLGELAALTGTSKAGIYHYFATKQQIYDAIILDVLGGLTQEVRRAVATEAAPAARLRAFMLGHARFFQAHYYEFVAMLIGFSGMATPDMKQEANRLRDEHEQLLRTIVQHGLDTGQFSGSSAATTARAVLSMLNWMVRWYRPDGKERAETFAMDYYHLIVQGLLPR